MKHNIVIKHLLSAHFSEIGNESNLPDVSSVVVSGLIVVKSMPITTEAIIRKTTKIIKKLIFTFLMTNFFIYVQFYLI